MTQAFKVAVFLALCAASPLQASRPEPASRAARDRAEEKDVRNAVMNAPGGSDIRGLEVSIKEERVILKGSVRTQAQKDAAEARASAAARGLEVENELEVRELPEAQ